VSLETGLGEIEVSVGDLAVAAAGGEDAVGALFEMKEEFTEIACGFGSGVDLEPVLEVEEGFLWLFRAQASIRGSFVEGQIVWVSLQGFLPMLSVHQSLNLRGGRAAASLEFTDIGGGQRGSEPPGTHHGTFVAGAFDTVRVIEIEKAMVQFVGCYGGLERIVWHELQEDHS